MAKFYKGDRVVVKDTGKHGTIIFIEPFGKVYIVAIDCDDGTKDAWLSYEIIKESDVVQP